MDIERNYAVEELGLLLPPKVIGLDYFGARYFSGAQGRFTTPDWSAVPQAVPYADLSDPQTLNLYGYVRNNPLSKADPDGHCGLVGDGPCSLGEFLASVPDRVVGGLKFEANTILEMAGVAPRFKASNAEQADAMKTGESIKSEFQTGLAMAVPGPKGAKGEESGELLSRGELSRESAARLGRKAAEAEQGIGIHGVSTSAGTPDRPSSTALRSEVEQSFKVHDTPSARDPQHRTVELPKPVTQKVADLFNKIFGR